MKTYLIEMLTATWHLLLDAGVYMLFGLIIAGLLQVFLKPATVSRHLGRGRFGSVLRAALIGIPLPLCSCGVLPAAAALKKQGATNGATTAFVISTPESGVDSIAVTYALMDPIMTVARPIAAFMTAAVAGITENLIAPPPPPIPVLSNGALNDGEITGWVGKVREGVRFAFEEIWSYLSKWFWIGLLLAGAIVVWLPDDAVERYLSEGALPYLVMLAFGVPLYICATASTPIAAALVLKGVSPGAALVFLLAGPATNITSLTMMIGLLGKRATAIYLASIGIMSLMLGWSLDQVYQWTGISAEAVMAEAGEIMPPLVQWVAALTLIALSLGVIIGPRLRQGNGQPTIPPSQNPRIDRFSPG